MNFKYRIHELAQLDFEESVEWYAARSIKAAENFITEVEYTLELIAQYPFRFRNEYKNFRELGLKKYPFVIVYTVEEAEQLVSVMAIFHTSRNPKKKYRKL